MKSFKIAIFVLDEIYSEQHKNFKSGCQSTLIFTIHLRICGFIWFIGKSKGFQSGVIIRYCLITHSNKKHFIESPPKKANKGAYFLLLRNYCMNGCNIYIYI